MHSLNGFADFTAQLREWIGSTYRPTGPGSATAEESRFLPLAHQLFTLQFEHNEPYRRFCESRRATPDRVEHWTQIPAMPAAAFKESAVSCLPAPDRVAVFHSSGTSDRQPSRHYHSRQSLAVYEASLWPWFQRHLLGDQAPGSSRFELLFLTPAPADAPYSSLVHMFETVRHQLGAAFAAFLGRVTSDLAWDLDLDEATSRLRRAEQHGRPALILGTAFSFVHLLDHLESQAQRLILPAGSRLLETGGYKSRSRSLPKTELHSLITRWLGVAPDRIICEYGMSELSSQAYDCAITPVLGDPRSIRSDAECPRCFRFPPWARAQIVSPETGREVSEGETGLVRVYDLANVYSVMAVQTEDLGIRRGTGFELVGRATLAEPRGCSLMAT